MASAKNRVIAGDYEGFSVSASVGVAKLGGLFAGPTLDRYSVESYELVTDQHTKSFSSGMVRGAVGGALLGPVGMLAGGLSAKNKGIYQVAIYFRDGKRSLLEVDDKVYKAIVKSCF